MYHLDTLLSRLNKKPTRKSKNTIKTIKNPKKINKIQENPKISHFLFTNYFHLVSLDKTVFCLPFWTRNVLNFYLSFKYHNCKEQHRQDQDARKSSIRIMHNGANWFMHEAETCRSCTSEDCMTDHGTLETQWHWRRIHNSAECLQTECSSHQKPNIGRVHDCPTFWCERRTGPEMSQLETLRTRLPESRPVRPQSGSLTSKHLLPCTEEKLPFRCH